MQKEVEKITSLKEDIKETKELYEELKEDEKIREDVVKDLQKIKNKVKKEEFFLNFSGKFDKNDATLEVSSGAGGRDAEDFVTMLFRMYQRFAERKGFKTQVISASYGEEGGTDSRTGMKSFCLQVQGNYAFGYLKDEGGAHRLVRQSPFSSAALRHTSFAQVEVFPVLDESDIKIDIKEEDLKIDTFRSSGPGGQHVNRRESAVRVTHLPTGITASSQNGRLQGQNKKIAIDIIKSKLEKIEEEKRAQEQEEAKGKTEGKSWGTQIRNYVLHPYKLVKDLKTNQETSNVEEVLDGNIDLIKNDIL